MLNKHNYSCILTAILITATIFLFSSCEQKQPQPVSSFHEKETENSLESEPSSPDKKETNKYSDLERAFYQFNWVDREDERKPVINNFMSPINLFIIYIGDINLDGQKEVMISTGTDYYGTPYLCEVFALQDNQWVSMGGFFHTNFQTIKAQEMPWATNFSIPYFRNELGRKIAVFEIFEYYGQYDHETLVETDLESLSSTPLFMIDKPLPDTVLADGSEKYYSFHFDKEFSPFKPQLMQIQIPQERYPEYCSPFMQKEYEQQLEVYYSSLIPLESINFEYVLFFELLNYGSYSGLDKNIYMVEQEAETTTEQRQKIFNEAIAKAIYQAYTAE